MRSTKFKSHRVLVSLPEEIAGAIDELAGGRHRVSFVAELLRRELKRRQQMAALSNAARAWKDEDHPELAEGGAVSVEKLRAEDRRLEEERIAPLSNQDPGYRGGLCRIA